MVILVCIFYDKAPAKSIKSYLFIAYIIYISDYFKRFPLGGPVFVQDGASERFVVLGMWQFFLELCLPEINISL